jgi:hypothetical protein
MRKSFAAVLLAVACSGPPLLHGAPRPNPAVAAGIATAAAAAATIADPQGAARLQEMGKPPQREPDEGPRETAPPDVLERLDRAPAAAAEEFGRLAVPEVAALVGKPDVYIYDNNGRERYDAGHVPTAKWLDYDKVSKDELPKNSAATLVFYCANEH